MAKVQYKAYTAQGTIKAGMIVADGVDAAVDALYDSGLTPFETRVSERGFDQTEPHAGPARQSKSRSVFLTKDRATSDRLGLKELMSFTTELATLVSAGLTLDAAFRVIAGPGAGARIVRLAKGLLSDVLGGMQLSEAAARRPEVFPADYCAILAAGEAGGVTGPVLTQLAELLQLRLELRGKIVTALIYPIVLMVMSVMSVVVLAFVLIPSIAPIFTDAGLPLPGILGAFVELQDNWLGSAGTLGLSALAVFLLRRRIERSPDAMRRLDQGKCRLPVLGRLLQIREAGNFSRALGTLLDTRVPLMTAMHTARALVTNHHLNLEYGRAINRVPEGTPLHRAFEDSKLFPPASLRMVAVGEESGRLGPMLLRVAATLEAELQRTVERMVGLLTPLLTLVVGGCIGGLIMHVMSAVLSINDLAFQ